MRVVVLLAFLWFSNSLLHAQSAKTATARPAAKGYHINIRITPLKNTWIYLYNYYGRYYQIADSVFLNDKSEGILKGDKKLHGGIYLAVLDKKLRLFEMLMEDDQEFSIVADTTRPEKPVITGSKENAYYQQYTTFLETQGPKIAALERQYNAATTREDSLRLQKEVEAARKELHDYQRDFAQKHPQTMLAAFFNAMKKPDVPKEWPRKADGSVDSLFPYRYTQQHYWDDVDFSDDRLVRTPFFEPKLEEYFKYYISPEPDSIIKEVKYMLLYAREGKEMYRYLLAKLTNKYLNPEIMGQDKVFVYLFENHYLKGDTSLLTDKDKETVIKRGWSLIANQIGEPAPVLNLVNAEGKPAPMHTINAPYTFIIFWDPNCGHCKETVPRIDSIYHAKWKAMGVKIYAVNVDENTLKPWGEFISRHNLQEWVHVYQTRQQRDQETASGQPNFRQLYDVYKTPTLYLLDQQKRIIAKNLDISGFDEVLSAKSRKSGK